MTLTPKALEREISDRMANTVRKAVKLKLTPLTTQKNLGIGPAKKFKELYMPEVNDIVTNRKLDVRNMDIHVTIFITDTFLSRSDVSSACTPVVDVPYPVMSANRAPR